MVSYVKDISHSDRQIHFIVKLHHDQVASAQ